MSVSDSTVKLKDEGNAFFIQKNYQKAYEKYSEAIVNLGPGGDKEFKAILFGNRAACCFGLERYVPANSKFKRKPSVLLLDTLKRQGTLPR